MPEDKHGNLVPPDPPGLGEFTDPGPPDVVRARLANARKEAEARLADIIAAETSFEQNPGADEVMAKLRKAGVLHGREKDK